MHQEDEPRNTIAIDRADGAIALGTKYNLQEANVLELTNR